MHQSPSQIDQIEPAEIVKPEKDRTNQKSRKQVDAKKRPSSGSKRLFKSSQRTQTLMGVQIVGCGAYVPELIVTNEQLEEQYGFEPGWIKQRSGILSRRHAYADQATSDLCAEAATRAIENTSVSREDIDLLLVGTFTPDFNCPSTACLVQDRLELDCPAVDLQAACSGFMYALITAAQYIATGNSQLALVIGGDTNTRIVNPQDQRTAPLFGDGAGAVLLKKGNENQGLMCYQMGADGSGGPLLEMSVGGARNPAKPESIAAGGHYLAMDGRNVFKWAIQALNETIELVVSRAGLTIDDVSLFLLHQANIRIIDNAIQQLGIEPERVINNLDRYGNTSAGSIPLAMDEALRAGKISKGDVVLMSGFGAGLTWGTGLFRW